MLLLARFMTGAGHGLSSACTHSLIAAWFPPKQKSAMVTANTAGIVLITFLTYTFTVPLFKALGNSWRLVLLIMGGVLLVLDIVWVLFARDNHVMNEYIRQNNALQGKKVNAFSGMKEALSRRDVLLLGIFMGFATIAANGITTYLPQFLHTVRGFTEEAASSIVGVASGISAAATIFGGFATTLLGKRKIIIVPTYVLSITFLTLALSFSGAGMISGMFIAYTIFSNMRNPASQTISTELKNVTPALTSSAAAISFGIGFIGTFFASPLLQLSISIFGEARQMLIYIPLFLISFTAIICMPETGPGRKSKA
jgi:predicted MFS family arabinose efflux permease